MNRLNIHPYQPAELQARIETFNAALNTLDARRIRHEAFQALPSDRHGEIVHNVRTTGGPASSIGLKSFSTVEQAVGFADDRRREAFALPIEGLALVSEVELIRQSCMEAWSQHVDTLKALHGEAVSKATDSATRFKGLSESAKAQHIRDTTQSERDAVERAVIPEGPAWHSWSMETIEQAKSELLRELQKAFARYS
jgi:hypothetical protein